MLNPLKPLQDQVIVITDASIGIVLVNSYLWRISRKFALVQMVMDDVITHTPSCVLILKARNSYS